MESIATFFDRVFSEFAKADFALLFLIDVCAFAFIFIVAFLACAFSQKVRSLKKKPFLYLVDLFTAITLTVFLCRYSLAQAVAAAAIFRCVGMVFYGVLRLFKPKERFVPEAEGVGLSSVSVRTPVMPEPQSTAMPAVQSGVRLDHATSIADKLLLKNLGRGDRQELEKIKTALTVLKVKGTLTPQEGENLNETFNTLLKLMAKYDL
ncbi:MAG: hypothetical protein ACI4QN_05270 [Candidatus Coproplasma sp.]